MLLLLRNNHLSNAVLHATIMAYGECEAEPSEAESRDSREKLARINETKVVQKHELVHNLHQQ